MELLYIYIYTSIKISVHFTFNSLISKKLVKCPKINSTTILDFSLFFFLLLLPVLCLIMLEKFSRNGGCKCCFEAWIFRQRRCHLFDQKMLKLRRRFQVFRITTRIPSSSLFLVYPLCLWFRKIQCNCRPI